FIQYASKNLIMVELDFPRTKAPPKFDARNRALLSKWGLKGFPSLILADAHGRPYANLRDKRIKDEAEAYVQLMTQLGQQRAQRDELLARASTAEGVAQAKLLDQALGLVPQSFIESDYGDLVTQIRQLDPEDAAGLRTKYTAVELHQRHSEVKAALDKPNCDWDGTLKQIDDVIAKLKPTGQAAADVWVDRARAHAGLRRWQEADDDYTKAIELRPDDPELWVQRGQLRAKQNQKEQADKDFSQAIELKTKRLEERRQALAKAPHSLTDRDGLSKLYEGVAKLQRDVGRAADAAATARQRAKLWPDHPIHQYNVACELALCLPVVEKGKG